jgi:hypothetical protein
MRAEFVLREHIQAAVVGAFEDSVALHSCGRSSVAKKHSGAFSFLKIKNNLTKANRQRPMAPQKLGGNR